MSALRPRYAAALAASLLCFVSRAGAQECVQQRPTDPNGYLGFTYGAAPVGSFGNGDVLVWYALSGPHAPDPTSTGPDGVPDDVARAAEVGNDALVRYASMGFRAPPSDGTAPACSSNGGDGRLDVYLVNFAGGADGAAVAENCVASGTGFACSSFVLVESGLGSHYGSFDVGIRTVLPHELFHAVQNAYNPGGDRYWAEGTAQWATDSLYPELTDMERFFPAFLSEADRPINFGGGGVVASFLYGSAIWPLFLSQRHDAALVLEAFDRLIEEPNGSAANAVAAALAARGGSLAAEFPAFATWNAATGTRAGTGGYAAAASYPEVAVEPLGVDGTVSGKMAGLSAKYFAFAAERPHRISSVVDPARLATHFVPLEGGKANLGAARALPTEASGEGVIVVAGTSTSLADAPFSLSTTLLPDPPPVPTMPPPTPTTPPPTPPTPTTPPAPTAPPAPTTPPTNVTPVAPTDDDDGGCALASPGSTDRSGAPAALWLGAGLLLGAAARRRVSRAGGAAPVRRGKGATT